MSDRITSLSGRPRMGFRVIDLRPGMKAGKCPHSAHKPDQSPGRPPCRRTTSALWHPLYIVKTALQPSIKNIGLIRQNCRKPGAKAAEARWLDSHLDTHLHPSYCPNRALPLLTKGPL